MSSGRRGDSAAQGAGLLDGDAQFSADGLVELSATDFDRLIKADVAAFADENLGAVHAAVDEDVNFLFVVAAADESGDAAVEGARLDIEGIDNRARGMQLLKKAVDVGVFSAQGDDFLADFGAVANFAGGDEVDAALVLIEGEDVAGLELDDGGHFGGGHHGKAQVLDLDDLAREGGDDGAAAKIVVGEQLADHLDGLGADQLAVAGGGCVTAMDENFPGHAMDPGDIVAHLKLHELDAVVADVEPDGLNLALGPFPGVEFDHWALMSPVAGSMLTVTE